MLRYLFSFKGRINRAKFLLYWPIAFAAEIVAMGTVWLIGWLAKLKEPMDAMSPFFPEDGHGIANWLGFAVDLIFVILSAWTFVVVSVKRLHDRNKGANWALFFLGTPFLLIASIAAANAFHLPSSVGSIIVRMLVAIIAIAIMWWAYIEMLFFRGTKGENRFGPDPLESNRKVGMT